METDKRDFGSPLLWPPPLATEILFTVDDAKDKYEAERMAEEMIDNYDKRIDDKWGPAGCIEYPDGYLFFGWASS